MNRRGFFVIASVAVSLASSIAACAFDEQAVAGDSDGGGTKLAPSPDGATDGAREADAIVDDPCRPDALCPVALFGAGGLDFRTRINVIRGRSREDVWAAGARGALAHFDGTGWRRSSLGGSETMSVIWLHETGEVAIASRSVVYTRGIAIEDGGADGRAPSPDGWLLHDDELPGPPELSSSWLLTSSWTAPGADWLWCTTLEFPGTQSPNGLWRVRFGPSTGGLEIGAVARPSACAAVGCSQMTSIHGASADDLWAVGFRGAAFHITAAQSEAPRIEGLDSQTWAGLNGVWAASTKDVWMVGGAGTIRHYTGQPFSLDVVANVPTEQTLRAVWGSSASDVWAVGDGATVLHYDGASWSTVDVAGLGGRRPDLYTVWTSVAGEVWAGGDGALLSLGGKP